MLQLYRFYEKKKLFRMKVRSTPHPDPSLPGIGLTKDQY